MADINFIYFIIITGIVGLCLGSFANVLIYRLPNDLSIIKPSSFCTSCRSPIKWYHNIPILSYLIIRGECQSCRQKISIQYPLVEFFTGVVLISIAIKFGMNKLFFIYSVYIFVLLVISVIDLKHYIIPDILSIPLFFAGLILSPLNSIIADSIQARVIQSISGIITGAASLYIIGYFGEKIFKKESMGMGDVKLVAGIGAFMGLKGMFYSVFFGSIAGSISAIILIYLAKKKQWGDYIPYGPFLALGSYIYLLLYTH